MSNIPDFALGVDLITLSFNVNDGAFREFCEAIDELDYMTSDELYLTEEVQNQRATVKATASEVWHNTKKTTGQTAATFNALAGAEGNVIKLAWNLAMKAISVATKVIVYAADKLYTLPKDISNLATKIGRVPPALFGKISGDITLYVTAEDIVNIYKMDLFKNITSFLAAALTISQGKTWSTFFHRRHTKDTGFSTDIKIIGIDDTNKAREMITIYNRIKAVKFFQTTINMRKKANVDVYLAQATKLKFKDKDGKNRELPYLTALQLLAKDLQDMQKDIEKANQDIIQKFKQTMDEKTFGTLNSADRDLINNMMQTVSKVISVIGGMVKCIMSDTNEINKAATKLAEYQAKAK